MRIVGEVPFKFVSSETLRSINENTHLGNNISVLVDGDRAVLLLVC